ncbi:MAG: hypothetical protein K2W97_05140 [Chthoniobacterales bacterium]|nr:hypothetical protein [Chthoniobacterales bacterium]
MDHLITGLSALGDFFSSTMLGGSSGPSKKPVAASAATSRSASPITTTDSTSVITDDGHSIASVDPSAGPEAKITFDIRARSVAAKAAHEQAQVEQKNSCGELAKADKAFEATPVYRFNTRATLHKASLKAQIKFNLSKADTHFEQLHVDYLDALSKSSLSPKEQHEKYSLFKKALDHAHLKCLVAASDEEASVGCSASIIKAFAAKDAASKSAATAAEQEVQKLLNDIQKPHTELRSNIAANLHYRHVQLSNPAKTEDEKARLKSDMTAIRSFQATGGLSSLKADEADNLNNLFKAASSKHAILTKLNETLKETPSTPSSIAKIEDDIAKAKLAFEAADKVVMKEIFRLRNRHALKNNLISNIAYRDRQLSALPTGEDTREKRLDLLMPKNLILDFLDSDKLSSLTPEEVNQLNDLFQIAQEKQVLLENLRSHVDNAPKGYTSKITADDLTQANAAFQEADDAIIAKISELLFSAPPNPSALQPPIPGKDKSLTSPTSAAATPLPDDESVDLPAPKAAPTSSSAVSAAGGLSAPPSKADIDALKAFAGKMKETIEAKKEKIISDSGATGYITDLKNQLESLTKLLTLLDKPNPPAEKINPLVARVKEIERTNKERPTVSDEDREDLKAEITALENQFMSELEKISSTI